MTLPTIKHPVHVETLPSGQLVKFRPYTMNEEKILLTGKEGKGRDLVDAVVRVVQACVTNGVDALDLSSSDFEYLFLKVRAKSVDSKVRVKLRTEEGQREVEVDLDEIEVTRPEPAPDTVQLDELTTVKFRRLSMRDVVESTSEDPYDLLAASVDVVCHGDEVHSRADFTPSDAKEFVRQFDVRAMNALRAFVASAPRVRLEATYEVKVDGKAEARSQWIEGMHDFFG
jgi:hypothetical protein